MTSRYRPRLALALVLVIGTGPAACGEGTPTEVGEEEDEVFTAPDLDVLLAGLAMEDAMAELSEADMAAHIGALAHDSMKGRRTGRPEIEAAAAYVAAALAGMGVEPAGTDDGFLARWILPSRYWTAWLDTLAGQPPNVVALIPGSDPELADSYVVITAHYDHIGTAPPSGDTDSIYNGADDNASGTAVLIEVAGALAALPTPPRRSVLFLAVSGEELGLLGSGAYMAAPTVAVAGMVANINLDMVSRGTVGAAYTIGYSLSTLGLLADAVAEQRPDVGLDIHADDALGSDLIARSDHYHFARNGIPAVGLFGGFHPDYHTPSDEAGEVDLVKAVQVARLATYLAATIAMMDDPPWWTRYGEEYMQRYW